MCTNKSWVRRRLTERSLSRSSVSSGGVWRRCPTSLSGSSSCWSSWSLSAAPSAAISPPKSGAYTLGSKSSRARSTAARVSPGGRSSAALCTRRRRRRKGFSGGAAVCDEGFRSWIPFPNPLSSTRGDEVSVRHCSLSGPGVAGARWGRVSREVRFGRIGGGFMECGPAGGWWFGLRTSARPAKIAYAPPSDASVGYGILFTRAASHPAWRHLSPPDLGRRCQGEGRPDGCHGARCGRNGNSAQVATPVTLWHKF
jgi:hypothetical protein